jgi:hypothetical protein
MIFLEDWLGLEIFPENAAGKSNRMTEESKSLHIRGRERLIPDRNALYKSEIVTRAHSENRKSAEG